MTLQREKECPMITLVPLFLVNIIVVVAAVEEDKKI